jgi:oligoribonuclease (3'-5' exoribonuclease)
VIRPTDQALEQMGDFVRTMHTTSGLLDELAGGLSMADAEDELLTASQLGRSACGHAGRSCVDPSAPEGTVG